LDLINFKDILVDQDKVVLSMELVVAVELQQEENL
tara:strand:+ start:201 stop:305 length:105 start_codon:yes stop_codon:yes gene_type:complete